ncbi:MAG: hypothetical protein AUK47_28920 [Deltaproteobacteria bacterium CG2_30_63_29]|nr:MAG: hypothetical protein AUK47_28920 [Deltaproteobacteria bacterium CG2_30_63_29]
MGEQFAISPTGTLFLVYLCVRFSKTTHSQLFRTHPNQLRNTSVRFRLTACRLRVVEHSDLQPPSSFCFIEDGLYWSDAT